MLLYALSFLSSGSALHHLSRRHVLRTAAFLTPTAPLITASLPTHALVKGSAPPPKRKKMDKVTCKSIDECERIGEQRAKEELAPPQQISLTAGGDRYYDVSVGTGNAAGKGQAVDFKFRVMRAGKRSSDGVSGEGSTIFSYGYGEEDEPAGSTERAVVGQGRLIRALDDGMVGLSGGIRTIGRLRSQSKASSHHVPNTRHA